MTADARYKTNVPLTAQVTVPLSGLRTFSHCQLCNHTGADFGHYKMWQEHFPGDKDTPSERVLLVCREPGCQTILDDNDFLYSEVPWSRGGPGRFMLICGNCTHRVGAACTHPDLLANGGKKGLYVTFQRILDPSTRVCGEDKNGKPWSKTGDELWLPAVGCGGHGTFGGLQSAAAE